MFRSRLLRKLVAATAGTMLLFCQAAAMANTCAQAAILASAAAAHEPCVDSAAEGGTLAHEPTAQPTCDSHRASIPAATVILLAAAGPPATAVRLDPAFSSETSAASADYSLTLAASPPLTLLHCRLRN